MLNNDKCYQEFNQNFTYLSPEERVRFHCIRCGDCCRHNKDVVALESYDAFQIAKCLNLEIANVFEEYCELVWLEDTGIPLFILKTVDPDESCIFLKDNCCTVQAAKPKTCRLYPFSVEPKLPDASDFYWLLCNERKWHFKGDLIKTKTWMQKNFPNNERMIQKEECRFIQNIAPLIWKLKTNEVVWEQAIEQYLMYQYFFFDPHADFLTQQRNNNRILENELKHLVF